MRSPVPTAPASSLRQMAARSTASSSFPRPVNQPCDLLTSHITSRASVGESASPHAALQESPTPIPKQLKRSDPACLHDAPRVCSRVTAAPAPSCRARRSRCSDEVRASEAWLLVTHLLRGRCELAVDTANTRGITPVEWLTSTARHGNEVRWRPTRPQAWFGCMRDNAE
jgi:hypothetical protein